MKSLIREIRQQPLHIRKIFMWTFVVITFSGIGYLGFQQTTGNFVALLNPKTAAEQEAVPDTNASPFALIRDSWQSLRASIGNAFSNQDLFDQVRQQPSVAPVVPQKLPVN